MKGDGVARRRVRIVLTAAVVAAMTGLLFLNREQVGPVDRSRPLRATDSQTGFVAPPASAWSNPPVSNPATPAGPMSREHPIGLDQTRNHLRIAALWHSAIPLVGGKRPGPGEIHLLAKIEATEGNPNGFARGDWIPYLTIRYTLEPKAGGPRTQGVLRPLVAAAGPSYGVNLPAPAPADYRLTFQIAPPKPEALDRFVDPTDGVAPWWSPFDIEFNWAFHPM